MDRDPGRLRASQGRSAPSWLTLIARAFDFRGLKPELLVWGEKDGHVPWLDAPGPVVSAIKESVHGQPGI